MCPSILPGCTNNSLLHMRAHEELVSEGHNRLSQEHLAFFNLVWHNTQSFALTKLTMYKLTFATSLQEPITLSKQHIF